MRTLLVYAALIGGLRFTGKRQLGELSTSEFAVTILVSELASVPLQDPAIPLLGGIVPLVTLLAVEVLLSCLCRRSIRFRRLLCGNPCMVIRDGKFDPDMLRLLRLSPEDVLEGLRMAGVADTGDVLRQPRAGAGASHGCPSAIRPAGAVFARRHEPAAAGHGSRGLRPLAGRRAAR